MKKKFLIKYFGNQEKTAQALRVTQGTVSSWADDLPFSVIGRIAIYQPQLLRKHWKLVKQSEKDNNDALL